MQVSCGVAHVLCVGLSAESHVGRQHRPPASPGPRHQTHLGPNGFSDDEIIRLLFGRQKNKNPKKAKPQLNVSKEGEGGGEIAGQRAEKKSDKGGKKTENEATVENEAPGAGGTPEVEVDQRQGSENGR